MKKSARYVLLTALFAVSANIIRADQEDASATTDDATDDKLGSEDEIFLFFLFSFFALCVSFFSSFLLYLSYLDDRIMNRYAEEGILIEGEVVTTEFTRGVLNSDATKMGNDSDQKEYFVSIEYSFLLSENYPIRIRKQLRVLECDFCQPDSCHDRAPNPVVEIIASRDSFFKSFQFDHGKKLKLLVLPDHYLSALPACQVKRRLSTKYRLYSFAFVVVAIMIAVFCFHVAAQMFGESVFGEEGTILRSFLVDLAFVMITLSPVPCIQYLFREMIQYSLEGEYFERGGSVIKGGLEDSSLSSRSDFGRNPSYFGYNRMSLETQSTLG